MGQPSGSTCAQGPWIRRHRHQGPTWDICKDQAHERSGRFIARGPTAATTGKSVTRAHEESTHRHARLTDVIGPTGSVYVERSYGNRKEKGFEIACLLPPSIKDKGNAQSSQKATHHCHLLAALPLPLLPTPAAQTLTPPRADLQARGVPSRAACRCRRHWAPQLSSTDPLPVRSHSRCSHCRCPVLLPLGVQWNER